MNGQGLARLRFRSLQVALVFHLVLAAGGGIATYQLPVRTTVEWLVYPLDGLLLLLIWWRAARANRAGDQPRLQRWALLLILLGAALLLQRIAWAMFGPLLSETELGLFRPVFAYVPFIYLAAVVLLPSRRALIFCWGYGAIVAALTLAGVQRLTGFSLQRPEELPLLLWVLAGNPLFLLLLYALPRYEDWLELATAKIARMREAAELRNRIDADARRFNLVVDSLQVGVWDQRFEQGQLVERWWSPRYYQLLGYTPAELPADEASARHLFGEAMLPVRETIYRQLRERGGVTAVDAQLRTGDRGWRWFNISSKAEFDEQGGFRRITGAIEDIHDRRVAEQELLDAQLELAQMAYRDPLTGLSNRRAFDEQAQREWERALRNRQPLAVLAIDLDWFKPYNDHYGHPGGDECLRQAAACFQAGLRRPADLVARVGGEEFLVLLPETDGHGALTVAEALEQTLRALAIPHAGSPLGVVSCSVGVAALVPREGDSLRELLNRADAALYRSKREGRARVRQDVSG